MRILAFEPFDGGSHRAVRRSICRHSRHEWRWLTRPARAWKWRMRLAAIEMLDEAQARGLLSPRPDAIVTTSLMSLADLRALLPPAWFDVPLLLYMHENQVAYPHDTGDGEIPERDVHFALTNLTSILAARRAVWNSRHNRDTFIEGITAIVRRGPDATLDASELEARILGRSVVAWPPVEAPPTGLPERPPDGSPGGPIRVVWPHRWEHDKGPDKLLEVAERHTASSNLRWTILGEQFRKTPPALARFRSRFADRIDHLGYVGDRDDYWRLLSSCDWVLSTARHEFFGIAVVEAMLAGCLPWLPPALSYPELVPPEAQGLSPLNPPADVAAMRAAIRRHLEPALAPRAVATLDDLLETLADRHAHERRR